MEITIKPGPMAKRLLFGVLLLVLLNVVGRLLVLCNGEAALLNLFGFEGEQNLSTLYSTALLWLCALLAFVVSISGRGRRRSCLQWAGIGLAFTLLGIDKALLLHEHMQFYTDFQPTPHGPFLGALMIPVAATLILLAGVYLEFLLRLPRDTQKQVLLAGMVYASGVLGLDHAGCAWSDLYGKDMVYHLFVMLEEAVEMIGSILFVHAFSSYIGRHRPGLYVRIASGAEES